MRQLLIKEIDMWSIVRTMFPLFTIVNMLVLMLIMLAMRSGMHNLALEMGFDSDMAVGGLGIFFASLLLGLIGGIIYTAIAAIVIIFYNALGALGGGIRIMVEDETDTLEKDLTSDKNTNLAE